jgi:hypothetical protein
MQYRTKPMSSLRRRKQLPRKQPHSFTLDCPPRSLPPFASSWIALLPDWRLPSAAEPLILLLHHPFIEILG